MTTSSFLFTCPINATQTIFNTFPTGTDISFTVTYEDISKQITNINGDGNAYVTYSGVQTMVDLRPSYNAGIVHFGVDGDYSTAELQNVGMAFQVLGDSAAIVDFNNANNIACFTPIPSSPPQQAALQYKISKSVI